MSTRTVTISSDRSGLHESVRVSVSFSEELLVLVPHDPVDAALPDLLDRVLSDDAQPRAVVLDLSRCPVVDADALTDVDPGRWGRARDSFAIVVPAGTVPGPVVAGGTVTICESMAEAMARVRR